MSDLVNEHEQPERQDDLEGELDRPRRAEAANSETLLDFQAREDRLLLKAEKLGERVRKLDCLFEISKLLQNEVMPLEEMIRGVLDLLPPAWPYPEKICARMSVGGHVYRTANFTETRWGLGTCIDLERKEAGLLEVFGLEEPAEDGYSFAEDEQSLLEAVAESLGRVIKRKRSEEKLRESEERSRTILNATADAVALVDLEGRVITANDTMLRRFGLPLNKLIGVDLIRGNPQPELAHTRWLAFQHVLRTRQPLRYVDKEDGLVLENMGYPILDGQGEVQLVVVYSRDITEQRRAQEKVLTYQEKLRELTTELSVAEERERRQIALDLHDGVGQLLALAQIKLTKLKNEGSFTCPEEEIEDLVDLVETSAMDIRSLSRALHPTSLDSLGLEVALDELAEYIQGKHGLSATLLDGQEAIPLDPDTRVVLFRMARELVMNVVKHAQAEQVTMSIKRVDQMVRLDVIDDGCGFDVKSVLGDSGAKGFGLLSIRERLAHLGGSMTIESEKGRGTRISIEIPLERGDAQAFHP